MENRIEIEKIANIYCIEKSNIGESHDFISYVDGYTQCQEDMANDQTVTRFEVIDENGRAYTEHYCNVELSYQDDGRTLKVFVKSLNKQD